MPIPKTRAELLDGMVRSYDALMRDVERVRARQSKNICVDDWTFADLLVVRTRCATMVVEWIEAGRRGETFELPAPGYSWRQTPALNAAIIAAAPRRSWAKTKAALAASHETVLAASAGLKPRELERPGVFEWAGKWPLVRWISISTTTGYVSARKFIRAALRE